MTDVSEKEGSAGSESTVLRQLRGKRVLITGTTGFLGKVILEKLMRAVPGIGGVNLVIRGNRHYGTARERFLNEVASASVFDHLKAEHPEYFDHFVDEKVDCFTGEITEPLLGLTQTGFEDLANRTDAVINVAASVDFREELDKALSINSLSLRNIGELVREGGDIPLIQISTCYVNGFNGGQRHEELVSPAGGPVERDEDGTDRVDELILRLQGKISDIRSRYTGAALKEELVNLGIREANRLGWNDTYTLTKWIGEQLLARNLRGGSVTILRPSIIESTLEEPVAGWIEGVKVADAVIMAYARGKVAFFPGRRRGVLDIIPADLVANSAIMSLAEQYRAPGRLRVYQCCSGSSNPITLGEMIDHVRVEARDNHRAYEHLFYRQPSLPFIVVNRRLFAMVTRGARWPLGALERGLKFLGQDAELHAVKHFQTTIKLATMFGFYTCPNYVFHNSRLLEMAERMGSEDRRLFPVDSRRIDWHDYIHKIHLSGLNDYALQEHKLNRLRAAAKKRRVA